MTTDFGSFLRFADGQVPRADPADLKSVWQLQDGVMSAHPQQVVSFSISSYERACSPGANVQAVFFRVSFLRFFQTFSSKHGLSLAWLHDGTPDDAFFRAFAAIPMSDLSGFPREELPFDLEELGRQIENEYKAK
jgi:hypothetical protein